MVFCGGGGTPVNVSSDMSRVGFVSFILHIEVSATDLSIVAAHWDYRAPTFTKINK